MAKGFVYFVAVMDWFSRRVLAWRVSITLETDFCVEALRDTMNRHGQPEIFNTDQGVQFTSAAFLGELETLGVRISMDGKGRFLDNVFIKRLWRSLKYEEVFIKSYGPVPEARIGIGAWLTFYNDERPHQALDYRTPTAVFHGAACDHVDNASASLSRYPHDHRHNNSEKLLTNGAYDLYLISVPSRIERDIGNAARLSLKSPRFLSNRWVHLTKTSSNSPTSTSSAPSAPLEPQDVAKTSSFVHQHDDARPDGFG